MKSLFNSILTESLWVIMRRTSNYEVGNENMAKRKIYK